MKTMQILCQRPADLDLHCFLTLCLRVSSADIFANSLEPDQAQQNAGPGLDQNCLSSDSISERFPKNGFEKNQITSKHENLPRGQTVNSLHAGILFFADI